MKHLMLVVAVICGLQIASAKTLRLTTNNVCTLNEAVSRQSMSILKDCISEKVIKRKGRNYPLYLYLNSPGGSIYHGLRFIQFAKTIRNLHTITEFSASMAAAISQGLPGKRYVTHSGVFMFHRAKGSVSGQFENGELEQRLKLWKKIVRNMEQMQADRIGITLAKYKKLRMNEWWLYGKESVDKNVADQQVDVRCSHSLVEKKINRTIRTLFGSISVEESACPLMN